MSEVNHEEVQESASEEEIPETGDNEVIPEHQPEQEEIPTPSPEPKTDAKPRAKGDKVGAVLVIGGGIAGMQSSLDLADSGFKVYLLDKSPTIGGAMSQLDKTFPTNDCAMCIMAPKLVETGRHHNIELITNADLDHLEGDAGNFKITLKKRARFVDESKCIGCGICTKLFMSCTPKLCHQFIQ